VEDRVEIRTKLALYYYLSFWSLRYWRIGYTARLGRKVVFL